MTTEQQQDLLNAIASATVLTVTMTQDMYNLAAHGHRPPSQIERTNKTVSDVLQRFTDLLKDIQTTTPVSFLFGNN